MIFCLLLMLAWFLAGRAMFVIIRGIEYESICNFVDHFCLAAAGVPMICVFAS